jgi:hypothetical protein
MKIFWSWQSDTPGKVGRHFIRAAILEAINLLKQAPDVEEPKERDNREAIHLDQDRQGVSGSPDLVRTILEKIDKSAVVVADVTPVSTISPHKANEAQIPEKRNMNPNVAIELDTLYGLLANKNCLWFSTPITAADNICPLTWRKRVVPLCLTFRQTPTRKNSKQKKSC